MGLIEIIIFGQIVSYIHSHKLLGLGIEFLPQNKFFEIFYPKPIPKTQIV